MNAHKSLWYSISYLLDSMKERGLWSSRSFMVELEKEGRLRLPTSPGKHRMVTQAMVDDIIRAFSPGGEGKWLYDPKIWKN